MMSTQQIQCHKNPDNYEIINHWKMVKKEM